MANATNKPVSKRRKPARPKKAKPQVLNIQIQFPVGSEEAKVFCAYARRENLLTSEPMHGWLVAAGRKALLDFLEAEGLYKKPKA